MAAGAPPAATSPPFILLAKQGVADGGKSRSQHDGGRPLVMCHKLAAVPACATRLGKVGYCALSRSTSASALTVSIGGRADQQ